MISFIPYGHIENINSDKAKEMLDNIFASDAFKFGCFRKIDGCNFQITIDRDGNIRYGKRSSYIGENDGFGNFMDVVRRYDLERKMKDMLNLYRVHKSTDDLDSITLFGELCGGMYRHDEVKADPNANRIQGRISYSPKNEFIAFDLRVNEVYSGNVRTHYVTPGTLIYLAGSVRIPCQICEFKGTLQECIDFDISNINDDTGSLLFDYPVIENQKIEGVVIKSMDELTMPNGNRIIFKKKNDSFLERCKSKREKKKMELSECELEWFDKITEYMNENRVLSAISKVGKDDFSSILREATDDAMRDFGADNSEHVFNLGAFKNIKREFMRYSAGVVRKVLSGK